MRRGLLWLERQLTIRRMLAIGLLMLLAHDLPLWWNDANWQGDANPFCGRQQLPAATGPGGNSVFAHRIVCETIAKPSMTYVYLHQISRGDRPVNLILRYIGNPPRVEWTDPKHVVIRIGNVTYLGKQVAILSGIHITVDGFDPH